MLVAGSRWVLSAMWQGPRRAVRLAGSDRGILNFLRVPYKTLKVLQCLFPLPAQQSRSAAVAQPAACLPSASSLQPFCLSADESRSFGQ